MRYAEMIVANKIQAALLIFSVDPILLIIKKAIIAAIANGILITTHPIIVVIKWRIPVPPLNSSAILKRSGIAFLSNPIKRPIYKTILEITKPIKNFIIVPTEEKINLADGII